jgi:hypothetical protein
MPSPQGVTESWFVGQAPAEALDRIEQLVCTRGGCSTSGCPRF